MDQLGFFIYGVFVFIAANHQNSRNYEKTTNPNSSSNWKITPSIMNHKYFQDFGKYRNNAKNDLKNPRGVGFFQKQICRHYISKEDRVSVPSILSMSVTYNTFGLCRT